jgi:hypothetical protein
MHRPHPYPTWPDPLLWPSGHLQLALQVSHHSRFAATSPLQHAPEAAASPRPSWLKRVWRAFWHDRLDRRSAYLGAALDHADLERRIKAWDQQELQALQRWL